MPGRDGLLHISKIGGGKRIKRVEDVLDLGQEIEVKVEDIDPNGKISLVLTGEVQHNEDSNDDQESPKEETSTKKESGKPSSFEDEFEESLAEELGELGPEAIGGNQQRNRNRKGKGRGGRR